MSRAFLAIAVTIPLAACAADTGGYPSLAPRAIESRSDAEPEATAPPAAPADAQLAKELADIVAQARKGEADFNAALPAAERAIGIGARSATSSENWVAAQAQLSALDAARAPTAAAMSAIDALLVPLADRTSQDAKVGGIAEAAAAQAEIAQIYDAQVKRLAELQEVLSQP